MIKEAYIAGFNSVFAKLGMETGNPTITGFDTRINPVVKPESTAATNVQKSTQVTFNKSIPQKNTGISSFNSAPGKLNIGQNIKPPKPKLSMGRAIGKAFKM